MHNCLCQIGEFQGLETLLRKCYTRIKYMLSDAMNNETVLTDQSGASIKPFEEEDADAPDGSGGGAEETVVTEDPSVEALTEATTSLAVNE